MALFPSPSNKPSGGGSSFSPRAGGGAPMSAGLMAGKNPVAGSVPSRAKRRTPVRKRHSVNIFAGFSFLVLLAAGIMTGMVFTYGEAKKQRISQLETELEQNEDQFEVNFLEEIRELDLRLSTAYGVVRDHRVVSPLLPLLGQFTIPSVQYDDFDFAYASGEEPTQVNMSGVARSYRAIAQQSQVFEANPFIKDFIFADFQLQENGDVSFGLTLLFVPEITSYVSMSENVNTIEVVPISEGVPVVEEGGGVVEPAVIPDPVEVQTP